MISGFFADVILEFLARGIARCIQAIRSKYWILNDAKLCAATLVPKNPSWGCQKTSISYTYIFKGQLYVGYCQKPFLSQQSAEYYAGVFQGLSQVVIRVNPRYPENSVLKDADQSFAPGLASQLLS